ncbi:hypothetical protein BW21_5047 [Burkholderia humptydooensis]|nr:hypothetical protein BW21_5047 [Burkholderia sp. 2002721687]
MRARTSAQRAAIAASPSTRANARASGSPRTGASSRTPQPLAATRCALSNWSCANGVTTCGTPAAYASDAVPIPP